MNGNTHALTRKNAMASLGFVTVWGYIMYDDRNRSFYHKLHQHNIIRTICTVLAPLLQSKP